MIRTPTSKTSINDLAIFGGPRAFADNLHVGRPNIGDREAFLERVNDALDRRWLTNNGPFLKEFEARMAEYLGVRHFIAVSNGTLALQIAVRAADLQGEVIVPAFTFVATAHALEWQGLRPVFAEVDPQTHNIDPARVEELITPHTSAVVGVHVWGRACDVEALQVIADRHGLYLMFDAAHAFGCSWAGTMIGNLGDAEIFSFHATKFFNTLEGGAATTNDDELARRMRRMRNFGFSEQQYDDVISPGLNAKMSEISAAMGLTLLDDLDNIVAVNYANYQAYQEGFAELPMVHLSQYDEREHNNFQYIVIEYADDEAQLTRDQLVQVLHAEGVLARRYFYPGVHRMEPYRSADPYLSLPRTEALSQRVISLPTGTAMSPERVQEVCALVRFIIAEGEAVARRMPPKIASGKV